MHKHVLYAIQKFEGVGFAKAKRLCDQASIHKFCKVKDLNETHLEKLRPMLQDTLEAQRQRKLVQLKKKKGTEATK